MGHFLCCFKMFWIRDIINEIWRKIQHPGLSEFIAALEVQQTFNPLTYDQILQSIAIHIPQVANFNNTHRNVSEVNSKFTRDGSCPDEGAHAAGGSLFIGTYHKNKWHSTSVRSYQQEIIKARGASPHPTCKNKKFQNEKKRSIRKIQKLTLDFQMKNHYLILKKKTGLVQTRYIGFCKRYL